MVSVSNSPVLWALGDADLHRLIDRSIPRRLAAREILHLAGASAERVHLLTRGVIKLTARDGQGRCTILGLAVPGDLVGDVAALDGGGQPLDAVAAVASELLSLDSIILLEALSRSPEAAMELATSLATRTRWLGESALERTSSEVPARMAGRLLWLAGLLGKTRGSTLEVELPLLQEDLGRLAGMSRESACKALRSFRAQGLLDYRGRRLKILRPDMLDRISCAGRQRPENDGCISL